MDPAGLAAVATALAVAGLVVAWERYRRRQEAKAWLDSVRSVISGDPDAAIEALSDAARLRSPQAIDTYLALGQLFRREGDLSRALRLHRNMLHGPDLTPARRAEVERELAEDYRRSGMLAEAAEILRRLAPADPAAAVGLREVLYEGGDLAGAIEVQRAAGGAGPDPILAHLLAARARQLAGSDPSGAAEAAARAVEAHPASADAWLATAELRGAAGDAPGALDAVGRALDAEPRAAPLAAAALAALPAAGAGAWLAARRQGRPDDAGLLVLEARALGRQGLEAGALAALRAALAVDRDEGAVLSIRELLQDPRARAAEGDLAARHALLVDVLSRPVAPPRCRRCQAAASARTFRCRACGAYGLI
ncbi:MAG: hypothetical protein QM704_17975 [Anaeromyxobacteraceae bacterium]